MYATPAFHLQTHIQAYTHMNFIQHRHQALLLCVKWLIDSHTLKPLYFQGKEAQQETEDYQVKKAVNLLNSIRGC